ncbi:LytR/AlgR family response regulator transcription factor [Aminipila terrae]|uniref:HTH LytTR-type domain-containing protein n=1 Tax=Aminipila terrae TaxID=2697030 RepID=A0A6P1M9L1_9FIRM|nr:LytTR family DNA-binding domain-containing protein [Aminipila terrae]QHI71310.1 hypothetical protein Ami3637_01865 [Aminipila terrae]
MCYIEDHKEQKNIIFIDIAFNLNNGIELASKIKQIQKSSVIIFMSDEEEYDPSIYDVDHVYFLSKPLNGKFVKNALVKAVDYIEENTNQYLTAITKSEIVMIPLEEITFIEKEKRKVHVVDKEGSKTSFYSSFEEIETQLSTDFYRCHNSYIINLHKIRSIDSKCILMSNGLSVPVSRAHIKELKELLINLYFNIKIG